MLVRIWRKGNPCALWWECKLVQELWEIVWSVSKKLKIELSDNPATLLLDVYPKMRLLPRRNICTLMFIAALFVIAKTWKQPKCPSIDEWIDTTGYIYTDIHKTQP